MEARAAAPGFTAVELLLGLALTGLLAALAAPFAHTQKRVWERAEASRESRRALAGAAAWITRDLQAAGFHVPGPPLRAVAPGSLSYVLSRDGTDPGSCSPTNRRLVTVFLEDGDLKYRVQAPLDPAAGTWARGATQVLAPGVAAMRCRGRTSDGVETDEPTRVALVECDLVSRRGEALRVAVRLRVPGAGA